MEKIPEKSAKEQLTTTLPSVSIGNYEGGTYIAGITKTLDNRKTKDFMEAMMTIKNKSVLTSYVPELQSEEITEEIKEKIDDIFIELRELDNGIAQSQVGIDDLKTETRDMLKTLRQNII